jgi:formylglycine-generating enzyme required for sulfatase activity
VALPTPIPDNPLRWDGWRSYNSEDLYARLCLSFESNPPPEEIEDHCRQLLVWWQKKLPLKNQPSNPLSQLLRAGLDEAPAFLAEARTKLLDVTTRAAFDAQLHARILDQALLEFKKLLNFAVGENKLREEDEQRLYTRGRGLGLADSEMKKTIDAEVVRMGIERVSATPAVPITPAPEPAPVAPAIVPTRENGNPFDEFRRTLRYSRLCQDGDEMTDDQRDALCNIGESLGLTGGQAEDLIDEYLEEAGSLPMAPAGVSPSSTAGAAAVACAPAAPAQQTRKPVPPPAPAAARPAKTVVNVSPLARAQERMRYAKFTNSVGIEMLFVTSGEFSMGATSREAAPHEQPVTKVTQSCFYMARHPVTNAQYEQFDPAHQARRAPWANDKHPVVYVNSHDAEKFCQWLSAREGKKYRLPTEAEWEYAARGSDGRIFPWGDRLDAGHYANFADKRTAFAWSDQTIDDGFAETAPVGSFPRGASAFGLEDMAGNVFEWCVDFFENYKGKERTNPRGPTNGTKRIYRGGSWRSLATNLRGSARNFNQPDYSSNDVGFRIVCEADPNAPMPENKNSQS